MGAPTSTQPGQALVVVDMQHGFIDPSDGAGVPGADAVLRAVHRRVEHAHRLGWPVLLTRDVDPFGGSGPGLRHDAALHPELVGKGMVVDKGPGSRGCFSGFVLMPTAPPAGAGRGGLSDLAARLQKAAVEQVEVVGLAADVCVSATARDARRLGYEVSVDLAASAFVHAHPDGDAAAVAELQAAGVTVAGEEQR